MSAEPARFSTARDSGPAGLYVHVPFCRGKCPYCHFYSVPHDAGRTAVWLRGLDAEAALRSGLGLRFDTLYFGGGTPSLLPPEEFAAAVAPLARRLSLRLREFTVEANPGEVDGERLHAWRRAGVTRVSLGAQSFDDAVLAVLGRRGSAAETRAAARLCREAGIPGIGLDLMTGLPDETDATVRSNLEAVRTLRPDHVSVYFLEDVDDLPFAPVLAARPVDEDEAVRRFEVLAAGLRESGLRRYEVSNFARPGRESRHNLKYWRYEPFLGLGPAAASHAAGERWTNLADLEAWAAALGRGEAPTAEMVRPDRERRFREALVFGLRLTAGIDLTEFRARFGIDPEAVFETEIADLRGAGLLIREDHRLRIPEDRMLVSNAVFSRFV